MPGGLPTFVTIIEPGRVATWVWPAPRTVMSLPNTKAESVLLAETSMMVMPPRMPMVLDGVVMVIALLLLILPPTRRSTPLLALMANSPVLVLGSNTNLSMVSWALGPTVRD